MTMFLRALAGFVLLGFLFGCSCLSVNGARFISFNKTDVETICSKLHPVKGSGSYDTELAERIGCR